MDYHSLMAVAIFKKACDIVDKFFVSEINDGRMNHGTDFVFKTSWISAEIRLLMDQELDPGNQLQLEDVYFDGVYTRCHGFISLGLWLYHRAM